jgi:hypothetical protein
MCAWVARLVPEGIPLPGLGRMPGLGSGTGGYDRACPFSVGQCRAAARLGCTASSFPFATWLFDWPRLRGLQVTVSVLAILRVTCHWQRSACVARSRESVSGALAVVVCVLRQAAITRSSEAGGVAPLGQCVTGHWPFNNGMPQLPPHCCYGETCAIQRDCAWPPFACVTLAVCRPCQRLFFFGCLGRGHLRFGGPSVGPYCEPHFSARMRQGHSSPGHFGMRNWGRKWDPHSVSAPGTHMPTHVYICLQS